jgi:hypothetical protein
MHEIEAEVGSKLNSGRGCPVLQISYLKRFTSFCACCYMAVMDIPGSTSYYEIVLGVLTCTYFLKIWAPCCSELLNSYSFALPSNPAERWVVKLGIGSVHVTHAIRNVQNGPGLLKSEAKTDRHFGSGRTWRNMCSRSYIRRMNTLTLVVSSPQLCSSSQQGGHPPVYAGHEKQRTNQACAAKHQSESTRLFARSSRNQSRCRAGST